MKNCVFVLSASGVFVQHGPVRKSEAQASAVARSLARRLGWVAVAASEKPADRTPDSAQPTEALAGLSPVWKDETLAARWESGKGVRVAKVAVPEPVVVPPVVQAKPKRVRKPKAKAEAEVAPATV